MNDVDAEWRQRHEAAPDLGDDELVDLLESEGADANGADPQFDQYTDGHRTGASEGRREREKRLAAEEAHRRMLGMYVCVCLCVC